MRSIKIVSLIVLIACAASAHAQTSAVFGKIIEHVRELAAAMHDEVGTATIAVAEYKSIGRKAEIAFVGNALTESITTELADDARFRVLERAQLDAAFAEIELQLSDVFDPGKATLLGKMLGAEYLVVGSVSEVGGFYRVSSRVLRLATGEIIATAEFEVESDVMDGVSRKYIPPKYRIYSAVDAFPSFALDSTTVYLGASLGFAYDIRRRHSITITGAFYMYDQEWGTITSYASPQNVSGEKQVGLGNAFGIEAGYGYILSLGANSVLKPGVMAGWFGQEYGDWIFYNNYDTVTVVNSGSVDDRVKLYSTFTIFPSTQLVIGYDSPFAFIIELGYRVFLTPMDLSWTMEGYSFPIILELGGPVLRIGVNVYL